MKLKFGKYQGWDLEDVPLDYVQFMVESKRMWEQELERRELIVEAELPWVAKLVKAGYHTLAHQYHPDRGGTDADMQAINAAMAQLRELLVELRALDGAP